MTTPTVHIFSKQSAVYAHIPIQMGTKWQQKPLAPNNPQSPDREGYQRISGNTVMCHLIMRI